MFFFLTHSPRRRRTTPVLANVNGELLRQRDAAASAIFRLQQRLNISNIGETFMSKRNNVQHAANGSVICLFMNMRSMTKKCGIFVHIVRRVSFGKAAWSNMNAEFIEKKGVLLVQFARRPLQLNKFFFITKTLFISV